MSGDAFVRAYLNCAEWCGPYNEEEQEALKRKGASARWSDEAVKRAEVDCARFQERAGELLKAWMPEQAGHDFWLTRNGHGAGFWDRGLPNGDALTTIAAAFGECNVWFDAGEGTLELE